MKTRRQQRERNITLTRLHGLTWPMQEMDNTTNQSQIRTCTLFASIRVFPMVLTLGLKSCLNSAQAGEAQESSLRRFYVTVTNETIAKRTLAVRSVEQAVEWNKKFDPL